jgi:hypothetical protein
MSVNETRPHAETRYDRQLREAFKKFDWDVGGALKVKDLMTIFNQPDSETGTGTTMTMDEAQARALAGAPSPSHSRTHARRAAAHRPFSNSSMSTRTASSPMTRYAAYACPA